MTARSRSVSLKNLLRNRGPTDMSDSGFAIRADSESADKPLGRRAVDRMWPRPRGFPRPHADARKALRQRGLASRIRVAELKCYEARFVLDPLRRGIASH